VTFSEYLNLLRRAEVLAPDPDEMFRKLKNDTKKKYRFCLAMMEYNRTLWWRGQKESERALDVLSTRSLRLRYGHMPLAERRRLGAISWFTSTRSKDLAATEQMYCRWAQAYANAINADALLGNPVEIPQIGIWARTS
jgi:hypothetical protein